MSPNFNINRPGVSDEEINKHKNFNELVERFKQQSLKKARGDESWWKNKKVRYSSVIAGVTIVCTITYTALFNNQEKQTTSNETLTTQSPSSTTQKTKTAFINALAPKLMPAYSTYKVNNAKGAEITHHTSSKIKIPRNSFVDKNGRDIIGDVTIEYKEFHDLGDVIAGGIPMAYDSAGTKYNLETAGMFDIKGTQDGKPVFIKPDKTLEVDLASANDEARFNQYYLDTLEKNWKYIQRDAPVLPSTKRTTSVAATAAPQNKKLDALKNDIEKIIPKKIDSVKVIYTDRVEKLPTPKAPSKPVAVTPGRPTFVLDGSYDEFPELAAFGNVIFEVGSENKNYSKELHNITWSDVKVTQGPVKGKNYLLTLIYRNRSEKLIVYPVLSGNDLAKAEKTYDQKLKKYQELVEKRVFEEKQLMSEMQAKQAAYLAEQKKKQDEYEKQRAAFLANYNALEQNQLSSNFNTMSFSVKARRLFQVSQFGIYNSDCPHTLPEGASLQPAFAENGKGNLVSPDLIYLVDHNNRTVYMLSETDGFKLAYDPKNTYSLCIFKKNTMYVCDKTSFRQTIGGVTNTFTVVELPGTVDDIAEFKKAIEI